MATDRPLSSQLNFRVSLGCSVGLFVAGSWSHSFAVMTEAARFLADTGRYVSAYVHRISLDHEPSPKFNFGVGLAASIVFLLSGAVWLIAVMVIARRIAVAIWYPGDVHSFLVLLCAVVCVIGDSALEIMDAVEANDNDTGTTLSRRRGAAHASEHAISQDLREDPLLPEIRLEWRTIAKEAAHANVVLLLLAGLLCLRPIVLEWQYLDILAACYGFARMAEPILTETAASCRTLLLYVPTSIHTRDIHTQLLSLHAVLACPRLEIYSVGMDSCVLQAHIVARPGFSVDVVLSQASDIALRNKFAWATLEVSHYSLQPREETVFSVSDEVLKPQINRELSPSPSEALSAKVQTSSNVQSLPPRPEFLPESLRSERVQPVVPRERLVALRSVRPMPVLHSARRPAPLSLRTSRHDRESGDMSPCDSPQVLIKDAFESAQGAQK